MEVFLNLLLRKERFSTPRGPLNLEQLCELSIDELDALAVTLNDEYDNSPKRSFIRKPGKKSALVKEKRDAVIAILERKVSDQEEAQHRKESKAKRDAIYAELDKRENDLTKKSTADLKRMLKAVAEEEEA